MATLSVAKELEGILGEVFTGLSSEERDVLASRYAKERKGDAIYIWWFFNFHYAYVHQWKRFFLFFITLGGFCVWWVVDFFRIPTILKEYNAALARKLLKETGGEEKSGNAN